MSKVSSSTAPFLDNAKIIIVIGPLEIGGAERQAILLARYLTRLNRARVEIWGYGKPGRAAEMCDEHHIAWRVAPVPLPWSASRFEQLTRLLKFARALRKAKPDVILPFMFMPSVACGIVWRLTGARTCIWNQRCEGRERLGRWAEQLAIRFATLVIANSYHGGDFLINTLGVPSDKVRIVYNGVQPDAPEWDRATWRRHLEIDEETFVACMVANLQTFKDHITLLKAWRKVVDRLNQESRKAVLVLAGRFDEMYLPLKALAYDLDLRKSVRFLGPVKDITGLLRSVDIGVHSSVKEGCPNGVLECMAAGLAVAGTDYAGIREAIGAAGSQFLATPGDAESLANAILELAFNESRRHEAGLANMRRIESVFSPSRMYEETVAVIRESIEGARHGRKASKQDGQVFDDTTGLLTSKGSPATNSAHRL